MFCSNCGKEIDNNAVICPACGIATGRGMCGSTSPATSVPPPNAVAVSNLAPTPGYVPTPPGGVPVIPNHMVGAVLSTFCCCFPFGIVAIVYASCVNTRIAAGDLAGARAASNSAQTWMWLAFFFGLFCILVSLFLCILTGFASMFFVDRMIARITESPLDLLLFALL